MIIIEIPRDDICINVDDYANIPAGMGGIYRFYGDSDNILYVGKTNDLKRRIKDHIESLTNTINLSHGFYTVKCFYVDCPVERDIYETWLINKLKPPLNSQKTYTYKTDRYSDKYKTDSMIKEKEEILRSIAEKMKNRKY